MIFFYGMSSALKDRGLSTLGMAVLTALVFSTGASAAEPSPKPPTDFVQFIEDAKGASLQTAIGSYVSPKGVQVDLVGAIHIADKSYYDALNKRFKSYDAVLYELVGRPVKERLTLQAGDGSGRLRWLGQLQETMRSSLALESQLRAIDYQAANFVHADMSLEGFFESQEEKKETFIGLWWKAMKAQEAAAAGNTRPQPGLGKILELLCQKDSATELKRLIGHEFDTVEQIVAGIESDGGSAIIGERNKHALEILDREIKAGKKHLAIFYGAAHLPNMEERLLKQGYKLKKVEWLSAWTLPPAPPPPAKPQ